MLKEKNLSIQNSVCSKYIFQKTIKQYTQITVTGNEAEHSDLPTNKEVLDLISENILNNNRKKVGPKNQN